jgi:hypothetical protein
VRDSVTAACCSVGCPAKPAANSRLHAVNPWGAGVLGNCIRLPLRSARAGTVRTSATETHDPECSSRVQARAARPAARSLHAASGAATERARITSLDPVRQQRRARRGRH